MSVPTVPLTRPVALALWKARDTLPPDVLRQVTRELSLPPPPDAPGIDPQGWPLPAFAEDPADTGLWVRLGLAAVAGALLIGITARAVTLTPAGWRVQVAPGEHRFAPPGGLDELVPFGDPRIRRSGDGGWHACISPHTGRLLCVYEPERLG